MARGPKVKTGRVRIPVREEKRLAATTPVAQPAGFDVPRAQPPVFSDFEADTELTNALAAFEPSTVEPEQEAEELGYTPTVYTQTISSQDYGAAPTYETADEALANYNALLEEVQQQQEQTASVYNYNNYDPGDFARAGFSGPSSVGDQAASDRIAEYLKENDIPPSIEVDGQTLYFTTGVGENALAQTLGDEYSASGSYQSYGPAGTYSTVYTPSESVFAGINPYLRAALGVATGGLSEGFISATNIISGEADTSDFINVALSGVNLAQQSGSGGFTASSGSPITGTTAPRTLAEMAEAGDIVSITAGLGGIAEEEAAEDDDLAAVIAAIESERDFETGVADPVTNEVVDVTGVSPETPPTPAPVITPEIVPEPIVADPPETELDIEQPEVEQPEQQPVQQPSDSTGGGGADTGGGETGAGSSGTGIPEEGSGIPGTSGSGGIAQEEGYDPDLTDTMSVPNPDFDPESRDVLLQRQIYDAILRETDPVLRERLEQEYERMGGNHLEEVRAGVPREEVYADYPPEYIEVPYEEATLDEETFEARYPDGWLGGSFDTLDANKDGVVSDTELSDYEHNMGSGQGGEPSNIVKEILDALRLEVDTPDPSTGLPTDTTVEVGTAAGPTDLAVGTGQDPSTDLSTGIPSDTTSTSGTTGAGGGGVGTDVGGGAGGGTTGGGAGSGEAEAGAGEGEGEGEGNGEGSGTGSGSGSGSGRGSGSGTGTGVGAGNATRTTDSLFGDLLQLETQIGATQELLNPFTFVPVPSIQQTLQQVPQLRTRPPGMLTNSTLLQGYR